MHPAPRLVGQGLRGEVGAQPVPVGHRADNGAEGDGVVGGGHRVGVAEIDLILAVPLLVVGAFRLNAHLLQHQADLPPDVLPLVRRGNVHVAGVVVGHLGGVAVLIGLEQVELHLGAEGEGIALGLRLCHRVL